VRVLGTIGWIVAGLIVSALAIDKTAQPMILAAGAQIILAVFCLFLPHTPPKSKGEAVSVKDVLGLDALSLLKERSVLVFVLASMLLCIPLKFYYAFAGTFLGEVGIERVGGTMTLGQMSEIVFMLLLPLAFARLGVRWILLVGMICWVARYVLFAFSGGSGADEEVGTLGLSMIVLGILLHGVCYDFFFVAGQIYFDSKAPPNRRASAQGFLTFMTLGVGMFIGAEVSGQTVGAFVDPEVENVHDWTAIWLVPAALSAVVGILFFALFSEKKGTVTDQADAEDLAAGGLGETAIGADG